MKFIIIVLIIRFIATLILTKEKVITGIVEKETFTRHPAEFELR